MSEFSGSQVPQDRLKTICVMDAVERRRSTGAILVINSEDLISPGMFLSKHNKPMSV